MLVRVRSSLTVLERRAGSRGARGLADQVVETAETAPAAEVPPEEHDREDDQDRHDAAAPERHRGAAAHPPPAVVLDLRAVELRVLPEPHGAVIPRGSTPITTLRAVDGPVEPTELVPRLEESPIALAHVEVGAGDAWDPSHADHDTLLWVVAGEGTLSLGGNSFLLEPSTAALVLAGEVASVEASSALRLLRVTVGPGADRHAPLGRRETTVRLDEAGAEAATGARSFQVLFGPHNGSTRATFFAGFIPPGRAPWHYHLYDEIVWVSDGPGRLHLGGGVQDLAPGDAFRLRPRQVHIVENASDDRELAILGIFTPAGSPSAAYLSAEVAATYEFAG